MSFFEGSLEKKFCFLILKDILTKLFLPAFAEHKLLGFLFSFEYVPLKEVFNYLFHFSQAIREEVEEKFNDGCFEWDIRRAHDCATLLKQFLR